jgi:transcriptional regulator with XRE-family HTH domain
MTTTRQLQDLVLLRRALADGTARRLREAAGLSLADVARPAGVTAATISRWESGTRTPRAEQALRYAAVLKALQAVPHEAA